MTDKTDKPNWFTRHKIIIGIVAAILLIGIGSAITQGANTPTVTQTNNTSSKSSNSSNTNSSSTSSTSSSSSSSDGHVGDTMQIGGNSGLDITLTKVVDPATGDESEDSTPDPGNRFVAIELTITNKGSSVYNDDANSDVAVIGSDNQTYTADFDDVDECTNFNDGDYTLNAGEDASGCVVFQMPTGVNVAKVQFTDESADNSGTAEWVVQ